MRVFLLMLLTVSIYTSCVTVKQMLKAQQYEKAAEFCLKKLNKKSRPVEHSKQLRAALFGMYAQSMILLDSNSVASLQHYEYCFKKLKYRVDIFNRSKLYFNDSLILLDIKLNRLYDSVKTTTIALKKKYADEQLANYYNVSIKSYAEMAHKAYTNLKLEYEVNNDVIDSLIEESFEAATIDITIITKEKFRYKSDLFEIPNNLFPYYRFIFDENYKSCDCLIELKKVKFYSSTTNSSSNECYSKEVIDHYNVKKDSTGHVISKTPVYVKKTAVLSIHKSTVYASGLLEAIVKKNTRHCNLANKKFDSTRCANNYSCTVSGDSCVPIDSCPRSANACETDMLDNVFEDVKKEFYTFYFKRSTAIH